MSAINNDILSRVTSSETAYADSVANNLANTQFTFSSFLQVAQTQTTEETPTASPASDAEPGESWGFQAQAPSSAAPQTGFGTAASQPASDAAPQAASTEQTDQQQPEATPQPDAGQAASQPPARPQNPASAASANASSPQSQAAQGTSSQDDSTSSPAANQDAATASGGNSQDGKQGSNGAASTADAGSSSAAAPDGNSQKAKKDDTSAVVVDISTAADDHGYMVPAANAPLAGTAGGNWKAGPAAGSGGKKGNAAAGEASANRSQTTASHATKSGAATQATAAQATATSAATTQTTAQTTASSTPANTPASPPGGQTAASTTAVAGNSAAVPTASSSSAQEAAAADTLANAAAATAAAPSNTPASPATELRSWPTPGSLPAVLGGLRATAGGQATQTTVSGAAEGDIEPGLAPESQVTSQTPATAFIDALSQSNPGGSTGTTAAKPETATSNPASAAPQIAGQGTATAGSESSTAPASDTNLSQADRVRFVERVEQAFQGLSAEGGSIRLRLSPPELGSLHIVISVAKGAMTARVEAETPAARNILLDNLPALRDRLAQQDIKVQRFDVDLMDRSGSGTANNQSSQQQNSSRQSGNSAAARASVRGAGVSTATAETPASRPINGGGRLNVVV